MACSGEATPRTRTVTYRHNVGKEGDRLLTPAEVAAVFRVDPKTVTRWAAAGRISSIRTPGGHRRFRESEVRKMVGDDLPLTEPERIAAELAQARPTTTA